MQRIARIEVRDGDHLRGVVRVDVGDPAQGVVLTSLKHDTGEVAVLRLFPATARELAAALVKAADVTEGRE